MPSNEEPANTMSSNEEPARLLPEWFTRSCTTLQDIQGRLRSWESLLLWMRGESSVFFASIDNRPNSHAIYNSAGLLLWELERLEDGPNIADMERPIKGRVSDLNLLYCLFLRTITSALKDWEATEAEAISQGAEPTREGERLSLIAWIWVRDAIRRSLLNEACEELRRLADETGPVYGANQRNR